MAISKEKRKECERYHHLIPLKETVLSLMKAEMSRMEMHMWIEFLYRVNEGAREYTKDDDIRMHYPGYVRLRLIDNNKVLNIIEEYLLWAKK